MIKFLCSWHNYVTYFFVNSTFFLANFLQCKIVGNALSLVKKFMRWARLLWLGSWTKFAMRLLVYGFVCRLLSLSTNLTFGISVGRLKIAKEVGQTVAAAAAADIQCTSKLIFYLNAMPKKAVKQRLQITLHKIYFLTYYILYISSVLLIQLLASLSWLAICKIEEF